MLESLGAEIVEVRMPEGTTDLQDPWFALCSYEARKAHAETFPSRAQEYGAHFREFLEIGTGVSEEQYAAVSQAPLPARRPPGHAGRPLQPASAPAPAAPPAGMAAGSLRPWQPMHADARACAHAPPPASKQQQGFGSAPPATAVPVRGCKTR